MDFARIKNKMLVFNLSKKAQRVYKKTGKLSDAGLVEKSADINRGLIKYCEG